MTVGCGGDDQPSDLGTDSGIDLAIVTDSAKLTVSGTIKEDSGPLDGGDGAPLAGASVCIVNHPEIICTTTAADGTYSLGYPIQPMSGELDLAIKIVAPGHLGKTELQREHFAGQSWTSLDYLKTDVAALAFATTGGFTYPSGGTSFIAGAVHASSGGQAGATVTLSPETGHVVYCDANGMLDPALTATSTNGCFVFGNVIPGPYTLTVNAGSATCGDPATAGNTSWPSAAANSIAGYVVANSIVEQQILTCH